MSLHCVENCFHQLQYEEGENRKKDKPTDVRRLKIIFPFLRVFGANISKLCVHYQSFTNFFGNVEPLRKLDKSKRFSIDSMMLRIDEYINMYCADSLVSFELQHKEKFSFDFPKPFNQIEQVRIHHTRLYDNLLNFDDWFPNLQYFELNAECIDRRFNNVTIPQLKHLTIVFGSHIDFNNMNEDEKIVQMKNASEFIKANQQLHSVGATLYSYLVGSQVVRFNNLLDMMSENPRMSKIVFGLHLHTTVCIGNINTAEVNRIVNEHPNLVELEIENDHEIHADDAISMVRGLNSLKKIRFNINELEYNGFIDQLSSDTWEYTSKLSSGDRKHYFMDLHRK